jgi:phosphate transport system permease protein
MDEKIYRSRKFTNKVGLTLSILAMTLGMTALIWILIVLFSKGFAAISFDFFTHSTPAPGSSGGGLANAIVGSLMMVGFCTFFSTPIGILAGIFLSRIW